MDGLSASHGNKVVRHQNVTGVAGGHDQGMCAQCLEGFLVDRLDVIRGSMRMDCTVKIQTLRRKNVAVPSK